MRNIFFIIGLLVVLLSACRSHRQVVQQTTSDSTTVTFREVEKVIHLEGDTVAASMQIAFDTPIGTLPEREAVEGSIRIVPQKQTIETKRTKVTVELTPSGEIKATAISKELDEKVTVFEKTVETSKNSVTVVEQKEGWLKRTFKSFSTSFKTILVIVIVLSGLLVWFRFSGSIKSFVNKIIKKS